MSQEPERPPDSASVPTASPGVHSEVDDALAVAAASTAAAKSEPAESGESAASVDTPDGEPGIVDRFLDSAGAATSKFSDAAATGGRATAQAVASTANAVAGALRSAGSTTKQAVGTGAEKTAEAARRWAASVVGAAQGLLASDLSDAFNDLTQAVVNGSATIYDKAMDAKYLETHIGGGLHRLFDGGHTISGAWDAARDASADDTLIEEMLGAVQGLMRDVSTPMGLPLANWDKETFDSVAESLQSSFGIPKSWFADLVSYDAAELLGGTVGVVSTIFAWNKADAETFATLAASMGLSATLSANPLLLPVSVVALARAFHKSRTDGSYSEVADGAFKGAVASGASMGAVALVGVAGGPAGVALLAGLSAAALAHAATRNVQFEAVQEFVKRDADKVVAQVAEWASDAGSAVVGHTATAQRLVMGGAAATASAIGSAAKRAKGLVDRDQPEEPEDAIEPGRCAASRRPSRAPAHPSDQSDE